jgi:hypothetical protein
MDRKAGDIPFFTTDTQIAAQIKHRLNLDVQAVPGWSNDIPLHS